MSEEATKSRVLVVGATGRLGGSLLRESLAAGHPTFALVRPHHFALPDSGPLNSLAAAGATLLKVKWPLDLECSGCATASILFGRLVSVLRCDSGVAGRLPELATSCAAGGCGHLRGAD
jgi:hypothetical protein